MAANPQPVPESPGPVTEARILALLVALWGAAIVGGIACGVLTYAIKGATDVRRVAFNVSTSAGGAVANLHRGGRRTHPTGMVQAVAALAAKRASSRPGEFANWVATRLPAPRTEPGETAQGG